MFELYGKINPLRQSILTVGPPAMSLTITLKAAVLLLTVVSYHLGVRPPTSTAAKQERVFKGLLSEYGPRYLSHFSRVRFSSFVLRTTN